MKTFACQPWRDADARFPQGKPLIIDAPDKHQALLAATRRALELGLKWETITAVEVSVSSAPAD